MFIPKISTFYQSYWGSRWSSLEKALVTPPTQVLRWNPFCKTQIPLEKLTPFTLWDLRSCYLMTEELRKEIPRCEESDLLQYYILDPGSVFLAQQLPLTESYNILDMCAAPGGKTLILSEAMNPEAQILANEPHPQRRQRLIKNIRSYLPENKRSQVWVTGKKGGMFAKTHPQTFDSILVDAPCSGERFLIKESPASQEKWSPQRSMILAQEQYHLLTSALFALKPGGYLLFSTCSLSPLEGDPVIEKLFKKKKRHFSFEVVPLQDSYSHLEATSWGYRILPDTQGFGPFYWTLLRKGL
jgi:5-methylcytosine rRNA methyltransferase NSUN4